MGGGQGTVSIVTGVGCVWWLEGDKAGAYKLWLRKPCKVRALFVLALFDGRYVGMCRSVMGKCVFHKLKVHNMEGRLIVCKWKFGIV